ncbi:GNAT family N-acetyltransferase [Demequina capsici]|uniref:GNAT family N-acetyltransferase n=1 Tax=Demequina capsici TaxID=3075620 RepID=A0AA96F8K1_9MICO|nr:GNAT family N-acetyltransferase [Demequina sp. OYTSA14]WNM25417.1 GNAT family N-acetyltransferase [Demequina sp. OYTSA14]
MADSPADRSVTVTRADERSRYEIHVDGALAGFTEYRDEASRIVFTHTEVDDAYQGQGLASALVEAAVTDAASRDLVIVPLCPYTARWLDRHEVSGARIERR